MPTRRTILKAVAVAPLSAPFVRGAFAAGKLAIAAREHPVPGAGKALEQICNDWAARERVDLTFNLIGAAGDKDLLTEAAEAQVKTGHDIIGLRGWSVTAQQDSLVQVDDLVAAVIEQNGPVAPGCDYLGRIDNHWRAMPAGYGSAALPCCARIDYLKQYAGIDVQAMYPGPGSTPDPALPGNWTWENFLAASASCAKAGHFFGLGLGPCSDALDWTGAVLAAHGAHLVDQNGRITVKADNTRQALEWFQHLAKTLPAAVYSYDDAANDKALVAGTAALIFNAPNAYAAARRTAPAVAGQLWTFPAPKGPAGRFVPADYGFWGIWNFSSRIAAAKSLLTHLATSEIQERLVAASAGCDLPPFAGWQDFKFWQQEGPPPGTLYNYPPRGDAVANVAGYPAPPKIAARLYARATAVRMIALCTKQGKSIDDAMGWAETEIEGLTRS